MCPPPKVDPPVLVPQAPEPAALSDSENQGAPHIELETTTGRAPASLEGLKWLALALIALVTAVVESEPFRKRRGDGGLRS